jgi:hypothetical protein
VIIDPHLLHRATHPVFLSYDYPEASQGSLYIRSRLKRPPSFVPSNNNIDRLVTNDTSQLAFLNNTVAMSHTNSDQGSSKGKAPDATAIGFRPQANMTVEPPKPEDLQKSYASIVGDDAGPKGWYGSMSMSPAPVNIQP